MAVRPNVGGSHKSRRAEAGDLVACAEGRATGTTLVASHLIVLLNQHKDTQRRWAKPETGMDTKPERFSRKTAGLPGTLLAEYIRCGKPSCHCMCGGPRHGPYWRRFWREDGRTRSAYVRGADIDTTRRSIAQWHRSHPSLRAVLRELRELSRLGKEAGLW